MFSSRFLAALALAAALIVPSVGSAQGLTAAALAAAGQIAIDVGGTVVKNTITDKVFGSNGSPARQTKVVIYNLSPNTFRLIGSSFESGGFSPGGTFNVGVIQPRSIAGYSVESSGFATGVTGATLIWGANGNATQWCLRVVTSNPYAGSNSASGKGCSNVDVQVTKTVGERNEVYVYVR